MNDLQHNNNNSQQPQQKSISNQQTTAIYAGPIPPPEALARYEQLTPGLADRIIKMAENEGNHRRTLEANGQKAQIEHLKRRDWEAKLGQLFGFLISITAITVGAYVVMQGHDTFGTVISLSGLAIIVTAFIHGRKN